MVVIKCIPTKSPAHGGAKKEITQELKFWGYGKVTLNSVVEPSLVRHERNMEGPMGFCWKPPSPVEDPQANEDSENAVKQAKVHIRVHTASQEKRVGQLIERDRREQAHIEQERI